MKRVLYLLGAGLFLILGFIGAVLPLLPTTPFLLLATYCAARGSKRFHDWIVRQKWYVKHFESFVETRAMTQKSRMMILSTATIIIVFTMIVMPMWHLRIFLGVLLCAKYVYFIFYIKTIEAEIR